MADIKRANKEGTCLEGKTAYEEMLIALKLVKGLHDHPYKENPQWTVKLDPMAYRQVSEAIERAEETLDKHCKICLENDGIEVPATWRLPQSYNQGVTITYINVCDNHHCGWWDGADWDGSHLEQKIDRR